MLLQRIFRLSVIAAVLTAAVTLTSAQRASAAHQSYIASIRDDSGAPKGYNHIICYNVVPENQFVGATVQLFDQFFPAGFQTKLAQTKIACTPAKKVLLYRKPIKVTPNRHFVCYPINNPPTIQSTKNYVNQLEKNTTTFVTPVALCVPTFKSGAPALPPHPSHLMVYDQLLQGAQFVNPLQPTTVTLFDQFFPSGFTVTLGNPVALLTPTEKKLIHQKAIPVTPNGHWVWYSFASPKVSTTREYTNQLENNTVNIFFPSFLLVPTNKS